MTDFFSEGAKALNNAQAGEDFFNIGVRNAGLEQKPVVPDRSVFERTVRRAGAEAALQTTQVLDFLGVNPYEPASDYWKEAILENPHDTGSVRDAWKNNEFGTFLLENVGDSLGVMFPSLVAAIITGGGTAVLGARTALAVGPVLPETLAAAAQLGGRVGMSTAFGINAVGQGYDTADMLKQEGLAPGAGNVVAPALAKAALDTFGMGKIASSLGLGRFFAANAAEELGKRGLTNILRDEGFKGALLSAGKEIGKVAGAEGITEAAQEAIDVGLVATMKDESLWKAYPREMGRILDAGLGGAAVGGVFGGVGHVAGAGPEYGKTQREEKVAELETKLAQDRSARKEARLPGEFGGVEDTVVDYSTMGPVPEYGEDLSPVPLQDDPAQAENFAAAQRTEQQAFQATPVLEEMENPYINFANYSPYDGGISATEEDKATIGAALSGQTLTSTSGSVFSTVPTEQGFVTKVDHPDGKSRNLFMSTVGIGDGQVTVSVSKMVGVPAQALESFVRNAVSGGKQIAGSELVVKMPNGTQKLWKTFAEANGAVVEKDSFRVPLQPGALRAGQVVAARDTVIVPDSPQPLFAPTVNKMSRAVQQASTIVNDSAYEKDWLQSREEVAPENSGERMGLNARSLTDKRIVPQYHEVSSQNPRSYLQALYHAVDGFEQGLQSRALPVFVSTMAPTSEPSTRAVVGSNTSKSPEMSTHIARMTQQMDAWRQQFMPTVSVLMVYSNDPHNGMFGSQSAVYDPGTGQTTHIIVVNIGAGGATKLGDFTAVYSLRNFMTMAHEFGHALHTQYWYHAPAELRMKVLAEFSKRRQAALGTTLREFGYKVNPVGAAILGEHDASVIMDNDAWQADKNARNTAAYLTSDVEQFAESTASVLLEEMEKSASPESRNYISRWVQTIADFARLMGFTKASDKPAFRAFYKWLMTDAPIQRQATITKGPTLPAAYSPASQAVVRNMKEIPMDPSIAEQIQKASDIDIRGFSWMKHVLAMPQLVDRFQVPALGFYWDLVKKMKVLKNEIIGEADATAKEHYKFNKKQRKEVSDFLYWLNDLSEKENKRYSNEEVVHLASGRQEDKPPHTLTESQLAHVLDVQDSFHNILVRMEQAQKIEAAFGVLPDDRVDNFIREWNMAKDEDSRDAILQKYTGHSAKAGTHESVTNLSKQLSRIEGKIAALGNRNYVPKMRHGKFTMRMKATRDITYDGVSYQAGQTMFFSAFDNEQNRNAEVKNFENKFKSLDVKIEADIMSEEQHSVAGLPRAFIDAIKENEHLKLSPQQKADLEIMALEYSPSRSFTKHFLRRENIAGYSDDFGRTFANYMFRAAGFISKTQYGRQASFSIREFSRQKDTQLNAGVANNSAWTELQNFTQDHFNHVMSPDTDFARVRSFMSAWYLGFMPRSAIANLYQIPMATYPYLAGKYGDAAAVKAIAKAYTITENTIKKGKIDEHFKVALQRAIKEQQVDGSAIVELGAIGDSNFVDRALGIDTQRLYTKWVIDRGFMLFRNAEHINRRTSFLAGFSLEWDKSKDAEAAYQAGVKAIELTQFDMSKEARAAVFRGGKGVLLMFNQHLFNMTYLAFGGFSMSKSHWATGVRVMAMSALLAGAEGMPWAGLGLDMFDALSSLYKRLRGEEYTYSDARKDIREMADGLNMEPDLFMHGLTRQYGLGPLSVLSLFGAPNIDLSGSVNLGYPGSWAQMLKSTEGDAKDRWAKMTESLGGPAYSILHGMWMAVADNNPNTWKRTESALPAFARALSQGARWVEQGGEQTRNGAVIWPVGDENLIDAGYRLAGLTPTGLAQQYEQYGMLAEAATYWHMRKSTLMNEYAFAVQRGDGDEIRQARENIQRYNTTVKDMAVGKSFNITPKSMQRSVKMRKEARARVEAGLSAQAGQEALMQQYSAVMGGDQARQQEQQAALASTVWPR